MAYNKRSDEEYRELLAQNLAGKSVPKISEETGIPTQTLYKRFSMMKAGQKKTRTYIKRASVEPQIKPIKLEMAAPTHSGKIVILIADRSQVRSILNEVF